MRIILIEGTRGPLCAQTGHGFITLVRTSPAADMSVGTGDVRQAEEDLAYSMP